MPRTRGFDTKEKAAEAWNTWAGRIREIPQQEYNELNDNLQRDYPIENGKLIMPDGDHAFGDLVIAEPGGYESPWPRIYLSDYANAEEGCYNDDMFVVYKLRARWRLIEKDHPLLKRKLQKIINENDRNNKTLNERLSEWNKLLAGSGFPEFEENDLRGADLSGLSLMPTSDRTVNLRRANLSYSECHLLSIKHGYLYESTCTGLKGVQPDLSQCSCHGADFSFSYLPQSTFVEADLGFAQFKDSVIALSSFDGANCHGANFSSSLARKCSFGCVKTDSNKTICADLSGIKWDDRTRFEEAIFNELLRQQNKELYEYIEAIRVGRTIGKDVLSSIEAKPGIFGFSIDLRALLAGLQRWYKDIKKKGS